MFRLGLPDKPPTLQRHGRSARRVFHRVAGAHPLETRDPMQTSRLHARTRDIARTEPA